MNSAFLISLSAEPGRESRAPRQDSSKSASPDESGDFDRVVTDTGTHEATSARPAEAEKEEAVTDEPTEEGVDQPAEVEPPAMPDVDSLPDVGAEALPPDQLASLLEGWSGTSASLAAPVGDPAGDVAATATAPVIDADPGAAPEPAGVTPGRGSPGPLAPVTDGTDGQAMTADGTLPDDVGEAAPGDTRGPVTTPSAERRPETAAPDPKPLPAAAGQDLPPPEDPTLAQAAGRATDPLRGTAATTEWRPVIVQPQAALRQIADAVVTMKGDRLEIALSPEELGRVRLIVTGAERAAQVTVWVERPEVMDLLRRNTSLLTQHFSEAGLENAAFEFREDRRDGATAGGAGGRDDDIGPPTEFGPPEPVHHVSLTSRSLPGDRRIDIRL